MNHLPQQPDDPRIPVDTPSASGTEFNRRRSASDRLVLLLCAAVLTIALGAFVYRAFVWRPPPSLRRVLGDQRVLATAIESYAVDFSSCPACTVDPDLKAAWRSSTDMPTFYREMPGGPATLVHPIAYMNNYPFDQYTGWLERRTYAYYVPPSGDGWILISPGPDGIFNIDRTFLEQSYNPTAEHPSADLLSGVGPRGAYTFDPTNGLDSPGDIWRSRDIYASRESPSTPTPAPTPTSSESTPTVTPPLN